MLFNEHIQQHLREIKTCAPSDVSKHALAILEKYTFLERTEHLEISETIFKWAEPHAKQKPLLFCYAKLMLAFSFFYNERFDEAMPMLIETHNLFMKQNDLDGAATCTIMQGSIYRTLGNLDLALKSLWPGHEQLKKSPMFSHFYMAVTVTIGGIYFEMKNYEAAIPIFKNIIEVAAGENAMYWTVYALHGLGKVYLVQKKYEDAKECFEKAMGVADNNNHALSVCNSLSELGNYYFATGDYTKAEQFHERSLAMREQKHFIAGAITSCIRLGEIYMKLSKTEEAMAVLRKGLQMAEQIKVKLKMYQIHLLFSEIYESKNELAKSLAHYKQFHLLREQVEVEDSARKLKNAQLVFEAEQTKKENIIIKKQKEEIEKKNIELQETIDELTRVKIGRKARAITLVIAIVLFIMEDFILHFALTIVSTDNYFISLIVKMVIIFSLSPINKAVEHYLLKRLIKKRKMEVMV